MNKQEYPKLTETKTRERYLDGKAAGIEVVKAEGLEMGKEEGIMKAYIDMVKDKLISIAEAAERVGMPEEKFAALIK